MVAGIQRENFFKGEKANKGPERARLFHSSPASAREAGESQILFVLYQTVSFSPT